MSTVANVFGKAGETYQPLVEQITAEVIGSTYKFTEADDFKKLPPEEMTRVYWMELLYRAHWAASSNLLRHKRWANACLALYEPNPNYLAFCAALRGLTEAAADASHSLGAVPLTFAEHYREIATALSGSSTFFVVCKDLEDMLIHFQFAQKLQKDEPAHEQHKAHTPTAYLDSIEPPNEPLVKPLYAFLCQVVHPAAHSLHWLSPHVSETVNLTAGEDKTWIDGLCKRYRKAIEYIQMQSVNTSIFILQVLNFFDIPEIRTKTVKKINMSSIPLWHKIDGALRLQSQ